MTPRTRYNFWLDDESRAALRAIKERDGVPESEQIRRAIADWLSRRSVTAKKTAKPTRGKRAGKA